MSHFYKALWSLAAGLYLASGAPVLAEEPAAGKKTEVANYAPSKFIRITRDAKKQPVGMETATVRYVPASGEGELVVDLIGVVHVADRHYYEQLNKQMEQYDIVLYELVAPQGTRIPKGGKRGSNNPISMLQTMLRTVLNLESQTEHIDYTRTNFVHADLSPEEMFEAMKKRGETGVTLVLGIAADILRQQNLQQLKANTPDGQGEELDPLSLLLDPQAAVKLKRMMAQQMESLDSPDGGLGNTLNNILVSDRNKAAMRVFQKELAKGRKKIAIFYGAAHMPDFERRLLADFGLRRQSQQWLRAWDLQASNSTGLGGLLKLLDQ